MSLLYECINGIIQGGILETAAGTTEGDSIARLCVNKLRGMLVVEGDPNRKLSLPSIARAPALTCHSEICCTACIHEDCQLAS